MKKFSSSEKYDIFLKGQKKKPQKRPAKLPPKAKKIAKKHNSTKNRRFQKNKIHQTHIQIIHPDKLKHHFLTHSINRFNFQNIFQINLTQTVIQAL